MNAIEQQVHFNNEQYLHELEKSLAFERAMTVIESECIAHEDSRGGDDWLDLESAQFDISQEIDYLESRHLLHHHQVHPGWVRICDMDEPCVPVDDSAGPSRLSAAVVCATGSRVAEALDQISQQLTSFATFKAALAHNHATPTANERKRHARAKKV